MRGDIAPAMVQVWDEEACKYVWAIQTVSVDSGGVATPPPGSEVDSCTCLVATNGHTGGFYNRAAYLSVDTPMAVLISNSDMLGQFIHIDLIMSGETGGGSQTQTFQSFDIDFDGISAPDEETITVGLTSVRFYSGFMMVDENTSESGLFAELVAGTTTGITLRAMSQ